MSIRFACARGRLDWSIDLSCIGLAGIVVLEAVAILFSIRGSQLSCCFLLVSLWRSNDLCHVGIVQLLHRRQCEVDLPFGVA